MTIAEKLVTIRKIQRVDIRMVEYITGIDIQKIQDYETGKITPYKKTLELFAEVYNIKLDVLIKHVPSEADERCSVFLEALRGRWRRDICQKALRESLRPFLVKYPAAHIYYSGILYY